MWVIDTHGWEGLGGGAHKVASCVWQICSLVMLMAGQARARRCSVMRTPCLFVWWGSLERRDRGAAVCWGAHSRHGRSPVGILPRRGREGVGVFKSHASNIVPPPCERPRFRPHVLSLPFVPRHVACEKRRSTASAIRRRPRCPTTSLARRGRNGGVCSPQNSRELLSCAYSCSANFFSLCNQTARRAQLRWYPSMRSHQCSQCSPPTTASSRQPKTNDEHASNTYTHTHDLFFCSVPLTEFVLYAYRSQGCTSRTQGMLAWRALGARDVVGFTTHTLGCGVDVGCDGDDGERGVLR